MRKEILFAHKVIIVATMLVASLILSSCRATKEMDSNVVVEYKHDTTTIYIHDTTTVTEIRHDSVDREVERIVYIDTNGVVHERETVRLTKIIRENSEAYRARESYYRHRIEELSLQLSEKEAIVEVERQLTWLQKTIMGIGWAAVLAVLLWVVRKVERVKKIVHIK